MPKGKPNKKPVVKQSEIGNELHHPADEGYKYHATFCPTWRTELDCGEFEGLQDAVEGVVELAGKWEDEESHFTWQQVDANHWVATGHDGQVETNMPIAKIERVAE